MLIFLDTETTGNDPATDRLCQVCYRVEGEESVCVEYFKPPVPVSVKSSSITHITNKMLEDKLAFQGSDMQQRLAVLLHDGVLVAHNALFDKAMLEAEGLEVPRFICTLRVARFLDERGLIPEYNLQYLRYYLDLEVNGQPHDAEGDVNVLVALFDRLLKKVMEDTNGDREAAIERMIEISSRPSLYRVFNFGKHKGKSLADVALADRGYLEWLLGQKRSDESTPDEDWIYTLEYYLHG